MMQVIEEAHETEMDEEDLQEKAMIGEMLKRNYEREISDNASNSVMKTSRMGYGLNTWQPQPSLKIMVIFHE